MLSFAYCDWKKIIVLIRPKQSNELISNVNKFLLDVKFLSIQSPVNRPTRGERMVERCQFPWKNERTPRYLSRILWCIHLCLYIPHYKILTIITCCVNFGTCFYLTTKNYQHLRYCSGYLFADSDKLLLRQRKEQETISTLKSSQR